MGAKVRATMAGFYGGRRRVGDVFSIAHKRDFSSRWMEYTEAPQWEQDALDLLPQAKKESEPADSQKKHPLDVDTKSDFKKR